MKLYIIKCDDDMVKVGISKNPKKRFRQIEHGSGRTITKSFVKDLGGSAHIIEQEILRHFEKYKTKKFTEWLKGIDYSDVVNFAVRIIMVQDILTKDFLNGSVEQRTDNGFLDATGLMTAGNKWRAQRGLNPYKLENYFKQSNVQEFMTELKKEFGVIKITSKGRAGKTWVHPILFIDIALWLSPTLKVEVYKWLYDELIKYRLNSGDSYKKMCGVLYLHADNKQNFPKDIKKLATIIRDKCGVKDWNSATEEQLKLRDKIHENIALLGDVLRNNKEAIRLGIKKALEDYNKNNTLT